jgi:hypothetical protein
MLNFQIHLKLKQVIKIEECHERSTMACLKLLLGRSDIFILVASVQFKYKKFVTYEEFSPNMCIIYLFQHVTF